MEWPWCKSSMDNGLSVLYYIECNCLHYRGLAYVDVRPHLHTYQLGLKDCWYHLLTVAWSA